MFISVHRRLEATRLRIGCPGHEKAPVVGPRLLQQYQHLSAAGSLIGATICPRCQAGTAIVVVDSGGGQPIRDDYGYNQGESRLLNLVTDIGLSGRFVAEGRGTVQFKANDGRDWFHIQLAPSQGRITLLRNEKFGCLMLILSSGPVEQGCAMNGVV